MVTAGTHCTPGVTMHVIAYETCHVFSAALYVFDADTGSYSSDSRSMHCTPGVITHVIACEALMHMRHCMCVTQILGAIVVTAGVCTAAAPAQGGVGVLTEVSFPRSTNLANTT